VRSTRDISCEAIALSRASERAAMSELERARMVVQNAGVPMWDLRPRSRAEAMRTQP
jgi:hypothetical protein